MAAATAAEGPIRVLVMPAFDEAARRRFAGVSPRLSFRYMTRAEEAAIDEVVDPDVEVLVGYRPPRDLARLPGLRWIQLQTAGIDHLQAQRPWEQAIAVTNAAGVFTVEMAEYVVSALLQVVKPQREWRAHQAARTWPADTNVLVGSSLRGRTIVLLGYGGVGRETARLSAALGMRVLAVKARPGDHHEDAWRIPGTGDPEAVIPERIVGYEALAELAPEADALVVCAPLTPATRGLVSEEVISRLRPDAWLVSIGRGAIVDMDALQRALERREIGGAWLDVFPVEPLPLESPFWNLPNCIVTPHVSGGDPGAWRFYIDLIADNLARYVAGEPLWNRIDAARGY